MDVCVCVSVSASHLCVQMAARDWCGGNATANAPISSNSASLRAFNIHSRNAEIARTQCKHVRASDQGKHTQGLSTVAKERKTT